MLAAAVLAIAAATEDAGPDGLIPLTRNEIAHLLATVILQPAHGPAHRLHWSCWRRRHQHRADLPLRKASSPRSVSATICGWSIS